jgi:predicted Zn-dependent peptidase
VRKEAFMAWSRSAVALAAAALFSGVLSAGPSRGEEGSFQKLSDEVQTFELDNGLKFIVLERHDAPVFSYFNLVGVGAVNEVAGITGLAHMFEHMAFKGTTTLGGTDYASEKAAMEKVDAANAELLAERRKGYGADSARLEEFHEAMKAAEEEAGRYVKTNRFPEVIEEAGGRGLNAFTGVDITGYLYSLPSNKLELWALLESDRFTDPVLREFYKERNVVIEERRRSFESTPIGRLFSEGLGVAFLAHPYRDGVIGHRSDLENLTTGDARKFYGTHYVANNMVVALVGDVRLAEVKKLAEKYFSRIPRGPEPPAVHTIEPEQLAERRVILVEEAQPVVILGYHIPGIQDPDWYAYEMLAGILGSGRTSRLYESLVKRDKLVTQVFSETGAPGQKYPNLLMVSAIVAEGEDPYDVEEAIHEELARLVAGGVTEEELDKVRNRNKADFVRQIRSNMGLAIQMAFAETLQGDWRELFRSLDRMAEVTPEDVQRVAEKTLKRSNRTVGILEKPGAEAS